MSILVRELRHSPENAWQAFTDPAHLRKAPSPFEHGDPPAHEAVGLPAGSKLSHQGANYGVAGVLCGPGAGLGADRLKSARTIPG